MQPNRCGQLNDKRPTSLVDMGENEADIKSSPRYDKDAEILAVRVGDKLVASQANYERISSDLDAIRREYTLESSAMLDDGATQRLMVASVNNNPWLGCLNEIYGGRVTYVGQTFTTVSFDRIYNTKLLVAAYTREPNLIGSAEPGHMSPKS